MSGTPAAAAVSVPATTANLGPGFDAFGAALSLRMTVSAVPRTDDRVLTVGPGAAGLSSQDDNLVWTSLLAACAHFGWDVPDVSLRVETPIPQARGLGSSSAAIVGGLAIARVLAEADASVVVREHAVGDVQLVRLAAELEGHPDNVAPAIHGGLVACGRSDDGALVVRTTLPPATTRPVLLVPATESLTSTARAVLPGSLPTAEVADQIARAGHVLAGMTGAWPVDPRLAGDRLHEPPRLATLERGDALLTAVRAAGLHGWLSGAGPSLAVAVARRDVDAHTTVTTLAEEHDHEALALDWDRQGIRSCVADGCGVAGSPGCADCPLPSLR